MNSFAPKAHKSKRVPFFLGIELPHPFDLFFYLMLDRELPQVKASYRGELFEFVEDRAKALAERAVSCEDASELWGFVEPTGCTVWLAYKLGLISDKEAEECCSQMTSSCPMLRERFLEEWQKGFGFIQ